MARQKKPPKDESVEARVRRVFRMASPRKLSNYNVFMASYMRAKTHPGMTRAERNAIMRDGAAAWKRGRRGENPFPEMEQQEAVAYASCPECGAILQLADGAVGQIVRCGGCGADLAVEVS